MPDILDDLLAEALAIELRNRRGPNSVKRLRQIQSICTQSLHNPESWQRTRTVLILHNEAGSLGYFEEFVHKTSRARKLHRLDSEPEGYYETEIVRSSEWLGGPLIHHVDPPTETEISRIREFYKPRLVRYPWKHLRGQRRQSTLPHRSADELLESLRSA